MHSLYNNEVKVALQMQNALVNKKKEKEHWFSKKMLGEGHQ